MINLEISGMAYTNKNILEVLFRLNYLPKKIEGGGMFTNCMVYMELVSKTTSRN